ncbi:MAG: MltA domain-containing protein, partial [Proteobacteria bacterium]|nr:MltA domain-containing protein [Pseudomonadota bacterium]
MFFVVQLLFFLATLSFADAKHIDVVSYSDAGIIVKQNTASYDVSMYSADGQKARSFVHQKEVNGFIPPQKVVARRNGASQIVAMNDVQNRYHTRKSQNQTPIKQSVPSIQQSLWRKPDFLYVDQFYIIKSDWQTIGGFFNEKWDDVAKGYQNVCKVIQNKSDGTPIKSQTLQVGTAGNLKKICMDLSLMYGKSDDEYQRYFVNNFVPYLVGDDETHSTKGLFTGYYYPTLNASRVKTHKYKY